MKTTLRFALPFLLAAGFAFGQADANKAQVIGTVTDPNGAVVPSAKITVKNSATGLQRDLLTNAEGQYRAVQLDPGKYTVTALASGFALATVNDVTLSVGSSVGVDIRLQLQATVTTVEVADTMIGVAQPVPSAVLNTAAIENLPINGRRFQDFATLTPSVIVEPSRQQLSFSGQRGINGNVMVDGADYNQPFFGGIRGGERSNFNMTIPQSAVQEFQAVASGYAAEYGRSTGGVLNVITKSGTNDYHGEGFYLNRNRAMSADNPIFNRQPSESLQQFGGAVGGPIQHDKLFFFGAVEQQYANTPAQVLFTALNGIVPVPGTKEAYDYFKSLEQTFTRSNSATAVTGKGDYTFSQGDRLSLRYNYSRSNEPNSVTVGGALNPFTNLSLSNEGTEKDSIQFGTAQFTHLFSPRVVADLKFSQSYELRPRLANDLSAGVNASPIGTYGTRNFLSTTQDDWRTQITGSTTILAGAHSIKVGVDFNRLSTSQTFGFDQFGGFSMNVSDVNVILDILGTGGTFPNRFDNPLVLYRKQVGNLLAQFGMKQLGIFAQDSWRMTRKLSFDYGLRWDAQWNPTVEANNTALVTRVDAPLYPLGSRLDVTTIPNNLNQWAPRGGLVYTPLNNANRLVIRANAGLFYASTPMLLFSTPTNNFRNPPGDVRLQIGPFGATSGQSIYTVFNQVGVDLNAYPLGSLPIIPTDKVQQAAALVSGRAAPDPLNGANLTAMAPDFRNPRSFQTGAGFESGLTSNWIAGVQFNYVNTVWLQRNRDWNMPIPTVRATDGRPVFNRALRPVVAQGQYTIRESSARQMYRALTFQTQYRGRKFQAGVFYTLSSNFSNDDNERDSGGVTYENSFNLRPEYNYSNLDARHQVAANALYYLPWGLEISGLFRLRTGLPVNAVVGSDTNGDSYNTDRPYSAVGVPFIRNSYRNRSVINDDLRLLKTFKFKAERYRLQLSAEMFNFLNLDNVIFAGQANIYGFGISPVTGAAVATDARFLLLRGADGNYNSATTQQSGNPFQAQFGIRFFF